MTPDSFSKRSPFHKVGFYLVFLAILGVAGGALVYTSVMQYLGWSVKPGEATVSVSLSSKPTLWLYRSSHSDRYFSSVGGDYAVLVKPWHEFSAKAGIRLQEFTSLDGAAVGGNNVLVLPSAVALDTAERQAIQRYREAGGAVLLTWATGTRGAAGEWLGWDFIHALTGVKVSGEVTVSQMALTMGEGPISHSFAAGTRLGLTPVSEKPLELEGGHVALVSGATKFGLTDAQRGHGGSANKGLWVVNELGSSQQSRVAVLGFAETAWEQNKNDVYTLLANSLGWMIRLPLVLPSQWPDGQHAAAFLSVRLVRQNAEVADQAELLRRTASTGSVYVPPGMSPSSTLAWRSALPNWDLGYWVDDLGQVSTVISALPFVAGQDLIVGVQLDARQSAGSFDQAYFEAGGRYRLGGDLAANAMPRLVPLSGQKPGKRFVSLPLPVSLVDNEGWSRLALGGVAAVPALVADLDKEEEPITSWRALLRQPPPSVWVSNAGTISTWWVDRERFQVNVRYLGARVEVDVSVLGDRSFAGGALIVMTPFKARPPVVTSLKTGMPSPQVTLLDDYRALVRFDRLSAGNYFYQMTF